MRKTSAYTLPKCFNPNRSLDRYSANRYREDNFLSSFILLLASCFSFVLAVARYVFELTTNYLLNNPMKSVQYLMTDLGSKKHCRQTKAETPLICYTKIAKSGVQKVFCALFCQFFTLCPFYNPYMNRGLSQKEGRKGAKEGL